LHRLSQMVNCSDTIWLTIDPLQQALTIG